MRAAQKGVSVWQSDSSNCKSAGAEQLWLQSDAVAQAVACCQGGAQSMNRHPHLAGDTATNQPVLVTTLPRFEDLKRVMAAGWSVRNAHYVLHGWHNPLHKRPGIAYGLLVPKRHAPRAARRSLIKRQMRAICVPALAQLTSSASVAHQSPGRDGNNAQAMAHSNGSKPNGANQFVIRFTRGYPHDTFRSAQSAPLARQVRRDLLHLLRKARHRFPTAPD